jgi:hypothetical protein
MNQNLFKAIVRSLTPWVISAIVYVISHLGYHVTVVTAGEVAAILGTLLTIGAHALEVKWPWFGVLLGWIGAPAYNPSAKAQLQAQVATLQAQLSAITTVISTPSDPAPGSPAPVA